MTEDDRALSEKIRERFVVDAETVPESDAGSGRPWRGKCLTCGATVERQDRQQVQRTMDAHADQLGHHVSVFQDRRTRRMMDGFAEYWRGENR